MANVYTKQLLSKQIATILKKKKKTLSLAESCTGGLVSSLFTDISGSSGFFLGAVVSYSNKVKEVQLGVPNKMIKKYGAVSRNVAGSMAKGVREAINSNISASITGIAGPTGGTIQKPVGLAYIGFNDGKVLRTKKVRYKGSRTEIKEKFANAVLQLILKNIS